MKKMKKLIVSLVFCFVGLVCSAEYLYWQVGSDGIFSEGGQYCFSVMYADEDGNESEMSSFTISNFSMVPTPVVETDVSGYNDYSFYIKVGNIAGRGNSLYWVGNVAESEKMTYSELKTQGYIREFKMSSSEMLSGSGVWNGGTFHLVSPEPTSSLLMLFGLASLLVKRKQMRVSNN